MPAGEVARGARAATAAQRAEDPPLAPRASEAQRPKSSRSGGAGSKQLDSRTFDGSISHAQMLLSVEQLQPKCAWLKQPSASLPAWLPDQRVLRVSRLR